MRKHKKWIRGLRWALLALMLWVLIACSKEESPRTTTLGQQESHTVVVPAAPTQSPVETAAPEETTGTEVAVETLAEERAIVPSPETEHIPTTEPLLILSGRVTLQDGSPATGTVVQLSKPPERELGRRASAIQEVAKATADENGCYRLVVSDQPFFFLTASREGSKEVTTTIPDQRVRRGEEQTGIRKVTRDIVLLPVVSIRGRVVDESDKPVTGIHVRAVSLDQKVEPQVTTRGESTTDENGRFLIEDIAAGGVLLKVDSAQYIPLNQVVIAPVEDVVLRLSSEGATLEGHVFLKPTGEAVSRAMVQVDLVEENSTVRFSRRRTGTDEFGAFRFERLAAGTYRIRAEKDDLFLLPPKDSRRHHIVLAEKEIKAGIELFLHPGYMIQGKVTYQETDEPLEGVRVTIASGGRADKFSDVTGSEGEYLLTGLIQPNITLRVEKQGYVVVRENPRDPFIRIELTPDNLKVTKNIEMQRAMTISGTVKTADGLPVSDARVCLYSPRNWSRRTRFTTVDESGTFTLEVEPFSKCRIKVEALGYAASFSDVVDVLDTSVKDVNIILKQGASVTGTVVGSEHQFIEAATVRATQKLMVGSYTTDENYGETTSDSRGNFTFSNLAPGEVQLIAQKYGFASSRKTNIVLTEGEVKSGVKLVLRKSQFLAGRITNPEGEPIEGVHVNIWSSIKENSSGSSLTDAEGRYRIEGLADTIHNLSLDRRDYASEMHSGIQVGRDDADFVLGAKGGVTFIGKVVDWKSGEPIPDFTVSFKSGARPEKDPNVPGQFKVRNLSRRCGYSFSFHIEAPGYRSLDTATIRVRTDQDVFEKIFKLGPGGTIMGRVISREGKEPLSGVRVHQKGICGYWEVSRRPPEATTTTGEDGCFQFQSASQGENTVVFIPPKPFVAQTRTIEVEHGAVADFGDVEIGGGGIIKGRVVQLPGAIPVSSTRLDLQSQILGFEKAGVSNENGAFEFTDLRNGTYALRVPDYHVWRSVSLGEDETQEIILRVGGGILKGVVLRSGQPVRAGIGLNQSDGKRQQYVSTDTDGTFEIKNLTPGRWKATIYTGQDWNQRMEEWIDIAPDGVTEKVFEFPAGRITGRVIDANEAPVAGAKVSVRRSRAPDSIEGYRPHTSAVISNDDGSFAIEGLFPDLYGVSASTEDLGIALVEDVQVPHNGDSEFVTLRIGAVQGGTLVSIVLNLTNGKPIPEAWCYLTTSSGVRFDHGQKRNHEGVLRITNIPPGTYHVQVSASGFEVKEHTVEIKPGETVELTDALYEAGTLLWALMDKSGSPLAHVDCRLAPNDPNSIETIREGKTDINGLWFQNGIYPGEYTVTSTLSAGREVSEVVIIKEGTFTQKEVIVD